MKRAKISIIGAGNVGATCAHWAAAKEMGNIVLVDVVEGVPQGKALDLLESAPIEGFDAHITGTNDYAESAASDIVIITAGLPRKPGMTRDELLETNAQMVAEATARAVEYSPDAILIVVSNPLNAMVYAAHQVSGLSAQRVIGQAGMLDAARFRAFLALEVGCSMKDVQTIMLGGQGDELVPLPRYTCVSGIPVTQLLSPGKLEDIVMRVRNGGAEIINLLKTEGAYYAPSASAIAMAESILHDDRRVVPCAAFCDEEYKVGGYFVGVPCVLGSAGVEKIIELELDSRERELFAASLTSVKEQCAMTRKLLPKQR